jgi:integrase
MSRIRGNGSIYQQPGCTTWTISFYAANGRRVRETTGTDDYRAAQQKLRARLVQVDKGERIEPRRRQQVLVSELYYGLTLHYRKNGRKSLDAVERRWKHIKPFFGDMPAQNVTYDRLDKYVDQRMRDGAASATINRELSVLKTMFRLGARTHTFMLPVFPRLTENNIRTGFIEQADFDQLHSQATELWLRLFLEIAFEFGWRKREILGLQVRQANMRTGIIRLDVGTTKNKEGREVTMTKVIRELIRLAVAGKNPDDCLLTRQDGKPVKDFRKAWQNLCIKAGLGHMICRECKKTITGEKCECGSEKLKYVGRFIHDFRRSAARELRRAGVAESTIMDMGGWKTASMFRRYAITDPRDIKAAVEKRQQVRAELSHDFSHDSASTSESAESTANRPIN